MTRNNDYQKSIESGKTTKIRGRYFETEWMEDNMGHLNIGDQVPEFALPDQEGKTVKVSDFQGKKLLLYFYPKANTSG